jgi:spermidine dehydrogenase
MKTRADKPQTAIRRRDFLNGVAIAIGSAALPNAVAAALAADPSLDSEEFFLARGITPADARYYPPSLTGLRGTHVGALEVAHALRDGKRWDAPGDARSTAEEYDLVIVGAGISGLAAAYFYRQLHGPSKSILVLDNHDDFGGHAKRNEFRAGGRTLVGYGGTQSIEGVGQYPPEAKRLLAELGIDIKRFEQFYDRNFHRRHGLKAASFFDRDAFGVDKLCVRERVSVYFNEPGDRREAEAFIAAAPLGDDAKRDLRDLYFGNRDYLPGLSREQRLALLQHISLKDFLEKHVGVHAEVTKYLQQRTHGSYGVGIDGVSAESGSWMMPPGFVAGLGLTSHDAETFGREPYIYHFPDGNASIARMLVRSLVPASAPGSTMEDIVTARMNYAALDREESAVRIRLNSTVVRVAHAGTVDAAEAADVTYVNAGRALRVRGRQVILACWNMVIPYLCPELPQAQKDALKYCVKVPLVYGTVQLRNWRALKKLGVASAYCAGSYFSEVNMDFPVSMGTYHYTRSPDEPCLLHLVRVPVTAGLPLKEQLRAGRAELLVTPFETFEHHVRDQLGRMFGPGGFDPARDIEAITINRWPHGCAYEYSTLWDPAWPQGQSPCEIGRRRFGRIAIANSDAGAVAETYGAIAQAWRACGELSAS